MRIPEDGCRYNERLTTKTEGSALLVALGCVGKTYSKTSSGHTGGDSRSGQTRKKPKDLSACEERGRWDGGVCVCCGHTIVRNVRMEWTPV